MTAPAVRYARARNVVRLWTGGPNPINGHRSAVADCWRLWPELARLLDDMASHADRDRGPVELDDVDAAAAALVAEWSRADSYRPRARHMIRIGWPLLWAALHDLAGHPATGSSPS